MADKKVPNLKAKYQAEIAPALMQKFGYKSPMQIPRLDKIVVNCGCGEAWEHAILTRSTTAIPPRTTI